MILMNIARRHAEGTYRQSSRGNERVGRLWEDAQWQLYESCTRHWKLFFIVRLLHIKFICHVSVKVVDILLDLFKKALSSNNVSSRNFYKAMQLKQMLGFDYNITHICKNDCVLFWQQYARCDRCLVCHETRWASDKCNVLKKVRRNFPLIPRLQRLFVLINCKRFTPKILAS